LDLFLLLILILILLIILHLHRFPHSHPVISVIKRIMAIDFGLAFASSLFGSKRVSTMPITPQGRVRELHSELLGFELLMRKSS
jgi:hypothetical protein